jgi:hypothetical protein
MKQSLKYFSRLKWKFQSPVTPGKSFQRTRSRRNILQSLLRGLTVNYNCSVVTNSSDSTVLNLRNGSKTVFPGSNSFQYLNPSNDTIGIYNQPNGLLSFAWEQNLEAVSEFGFSSWPKSPVVYNPSCSTSCYYNAKTDVAGRYPAFGQELAVEAILWQHFQPQDLLDPNLVYNTSISSTIPLLLGHISPTLISQCLPWGCDASRQQWVQLISRECILRSPTSRP